MNTPTSSAVVQKQQETKLENLPQKQASLIQIMAAKYNMDPDKYAAAIKKTAMPSNATNEEFAAFLMVAHEYKLNPLLREIYAFPKKGGGIVPMVSIDGWVNLVNYNSMLRGFTFETHFDSDKKLSAVTCSMWRKDRDMPIVITEYYIECFRNTEPWRQMPLRMLRHKALIQAARYCFGLSGVYDEDEARDMGLKDITPPPRPEAKDFISPARIAVEEETQTTTTEQPTETVDVETGEIKEEEPAEFGAPEAMELGRQHRRDGKPMSRKPEWPGGTNDVYDSAWQAGYDEVDAEMTKKARA